MQGLFHRELLFLSGFEVLALIAVLKIYTTTQRNGLSHLLIPEISISLNSGSFPFFLQPLFVYVCGGWWIGDTHL